MDVARSHCVALRQLPMPLRAAMPCKTLVPARNLTERGRRAGRGAARRPRHHVSDMSGAARRWDRVDAALARWRARPAEALARRRVALGFVCGAAVLLLARPTLRSLVIGGAMATAGEMVRLWAAGALETGREGPRSGPYRFTRHPLYIGSAIIGAGVAEAASRTSASV